MPIVLLVIAIAAVLVAAGGSSSTAEGPTIMGDENKNAILQGIVVPLQLPGVCVDILYAQAALETGNFDLVERHPGRPWPIGSPSAFARSNSLFNRHAGSGRGEWTGKVLYVKPGDEDVRIYTDVHQSARDMAQLLQDPFYSRALGALLLGDRRAYFDALQGKFSTSLSYARDLEDRFQDLA